MLITSFALILFFIFLVLGAIHFYWLFGGIWGLKQAIPTKESESNSLEIPRFATLIVALVLFFFGLIYLLKTEIISFEIPQWVESYSSWGIPLIFFIRAIGDFKYVGFFKKIKNTEFGKADTKLFSPLCLFIGIMGLLVQVL